MRQRLASSTFNSIKRIPVEPVVGAALFVMTLGVSRGTAAAPSLTVALVMLAASFLLPWQPWAALTLALCYFGAWILLDITGVGMGLCAGLFAYNWFKHHRPGRWTIAVACPIIMVVAWEVHDSWNDVLANLILFTGITLFSATTGAISNQRRRAEEKTHRESEEALRSTRLLVASELHDSVAQTQTLVVMNLEDLAEDPRLPGELIPDLLDTLELSRRATTELRAAMAALRNVDQDFSSFGRQSTHSLDTQLTQALSALQDNGFNTETHFDIPGDKLSPDLEYGMSKILGELVANVVWHGAPGTCTIEAREDDGCVMLRVINDIGTAAPAKSNGGHGLLGVKERVDLLNGTHSFTPKGHQWHAEVRVPLTVRTDG